MNLHEYQAKQLLAKRGVPVPPGGACRTADEAGTVASQLFAAGHGQVVVKSQIHAGGRGKGVFKSGFKGGVRLCSSADDVIATVQRMLGQVLVTKQTGPEGRLVRTILVEAALPIERELYLAVLLDRARSWPVMMACPAGGMDIEEVAARTPELIYREHIDPAVGLMPYQGRHLALSLKLSSEFLHAAAKLFHGVYQTWWDCDASLVEINPLCVTRSADGPPSLLALDAKISLEDNALPRHPELVELRDLGEESPLEVEASKFNLNYIKLSGNIACLVNGAGLAMATMDIIKHCGGEPANFLDVGGGASQEQVAAAFKIILGDPSVKAILVNIFGGIMRCDIIAQGIVAAVRENQLRLPIVVRLEGTNSELARQIIQQSGLSVISANTLAEAAEKAVQAAGV